MEHELAHSQRECISTNLALMIFISSSTPGRSSDPESDVMFAIVLITGGIVAAKGRGMPGWPACQAPVLRRQCNGAVQGGQCEEQMTERA